MSPPPPPKTALITGASSGLGAEFAHQLAALGYSLILTARREDRLLQVEQSIHSEFDLPVQIIPADLSQVTGIEKIVSAINSQDHLDLLINNAGFGTTGRFYRVDAGKEQAMVNVHVLAPVMLCRAALPAMVTRDQGAIINVSSIAGLIPIRNVLYHSTKSFIVSFSESLHAELLGTHLHIQVLCPGFVLSGFHDTSEYTRFSRSSIPKFLWMTPLPVVNESLDALPKGKLLCIPGGIYQIAGALARNSISAGIIKMVANYILRRRKTVKKE